MLSLARGEMVASGRGRRACILVSALLGLTAACGATEHETSVGSAGALSSAGGGAGKAAQGGAGGALVADDCPAGTGAWRSTSPDPFKAGRAQYGRCVALCDAAESAACAGHDPTACEAYCNGLQNNSVNGRCTDAVETVIACFEMAKVPCSTPQRSPADTCEAARSEMRCCFKRFCADPENQGTCAP